MNYIEAIARVRQEFPSHQNESKLHAIKKLREHVHGLGLLEAKIAMEHPENAIDYYISTGKFLGYSHYDTK